MSSLQGKSHKGLIGDIARADTGQGREFVTAQPLGPSRVALDTITTAAFYVTQLAVAEVLSTSEVIVLTGHSARPGDILRVVTTANGIINKDIFIESVVDVNSFQLVGKAQDINGDPAVFAAGDTFDILRPITLRASSDGSLASGPIEFLLDGSTQVVTEDTVAPANNAPLPVKLTGITGDINITANDLNVQTSHLGANFDSSRIGDGTNIAAVNASLQLEVHDTDLNADLDTIISVYPTARGQLASANSFAAVLSTEQEAILERAAVALEILDNTVAGNELQVDIVTQPAVRQLEHLPSAASVGDSVKIGDHTTADLFTRVRAGGAGSTDVDSLYVTDHLTKALLGTMNSKFVSGTDIGDVTINNLVASEGIPIVNETGSTIAVSGTQIDIDNLNTTDDAVRIGDTSNTANVRQGAAAAVNTSGAGDSLYTTDFLAIQQLTAIEANTHLDNKETLAIDFSTTNVTGAAYAQITAATGNDAREITIFMSTGDAMYLAIGAAAAEANKILIPPGGFPHPMKFSVASGARLSLKRVDAGTTSVGKMYINIIG